MLIIDTSLAQQVLLVTTSEVSDISSGSTLHLHCIGTNVDTVIDLPNDSSDYPSRYNKYVLDTSLFTGYTIGQYSFEIYNNDVLTESGLLLITNTTNKEEKLNNEFISPSGTIDDDDFIVLNN